MISFAFFIQSRLCDSSGFCVIGQGNGQSIALLVFLRIHRGNAAMLHRGGKDDLRARSAEPMQLVDELIQLLRRVETHLDEHGIIARHAVALHHVRAALDIRVKLRLLARLHLQADKRLDLVAQRRAGKLRLIALNVTRRFQPLDARADRRRGEKHLFGDHLERGARVLLQDGQNLPINRIHVHRPLSCVHIIKRISRSASFRKGF